MILYHGTCDVFLGDILTDGLKPTSSNAFQLDNFASYHGNLRDVEGKTKYIFLSPHKDVAYWFAEYRANYERAKWHETIAGTSTIKLAKTSVPDAKPVLLTVTLPDSLKPKLVKDTLSHGLLYPGIISPRHLKPEPIPLKSLSDAPYETLMRM